MDQKQRTYHPEPQRININEIYVTLRKYDSEDMISGVNNLRKKCTKCDTSKFPT